MEQPIDYAAEYPDIVDPPTWDEIFDWADDATGEAVCPHGCIIEHDGHCVHGRPSWVAVALELQGENCEQLM